jgi:hypothetical protein
MKRLWLLCRLACAEAQAAFAALGTRMDARAKEIDPSARSYVDVVRAVKAKPFELRATYTKEVARAFLFGQGCCDLSTRRSLRR